MKIHKIYKISDLATALKCVQESDEIIFQNNLFINSSYNFDKAITISALNDVTITFGRKAYFNIYAPIVFENINFNSIGRNITNILNIGWYEFKTEQPNKQFSQ